MLHASNSDGRRNVSRFGVCPRKAQAWAKQILKKGRPTARPGSITA